MRGWAPYAPCPPGKRNKKYKRHNWDILKTAIKSTMSEAVRMVDVAYATGIPTTILVGGHARNWDPKKS